MFFKTNNILKLLRRKHSLLIICLLLIILVIIFHYLIYDLFNNLEWFSVTKYTQFPKLNQNQLPIARISSHTNNSNTKTKIILLWTPFFGVKDYLSGDTAHQNNCDFKNCVFTSNRSLLRESDAIIFHLRDLNINDLPDYRTSNQRWILLNHESPANSPNLLFKLEGVINWTATYRFGSDIFLSPTFRKRQSKTGITHYVSNKTRMVVWLASNCKTDSKREDYVQELKKTITVDVYGECGDHQCLPKMSSKCLKQLSNEYRFILAFENSICRDYVTEKYFNALEYDIIPVVLGGSNYSAIAPNNSYIDALSYSSPRQLARYLIHLSKHTDLYNSYFKWKNYYELTVDPYPCQICKKLNNPLEPIKVWNRLNFWWFDEANCKSWSQSHT